jgi:hypothetical protein
MGKERLLPFYDFDHRGASAVYCSARDLLRFGMFHLKNKVAGQNKILTDDSIDRMKSLRDPAVESNEYRLGWSRSHLAKYEAFSHGGGMPGVTTNLLLIPELDIALAMLCNTRYGGLRPIAIAILKALIPDLEEDLAAANKANARPEGKAESKTGAKPKPNPTVTPEALLGRWVGEIYTHEGQIPVELLVEEDNRVSFGFTGEPEGVKKLLRSAGRIALLEDSLNASFYLKLPVADVARHGHQTVLDLKREGDRLFGSASAYAVNGRFGLPFYISLTIE